jgi:hypothetical protein
MMNLLRRCQLIVLMTATFASPLLLNSQAAFSASETVDITQPVPAPKRCDPPKPGSPFIDPFCPKPSSPNNLGASLPVMSQTGINVTPISIGRTVVNITSAQRVSCTRCDGAGEANCFEVKWTTRKGANERVQFFQVILEVTQRNGEQVTSVKEVSVNTNQTLISTRRFSTDEDAVSFKVTVNAMGNKLNQPPLPIIILATATAQG